MLPRDGFGPAHQNGLRGQWRCRPHWTTALPPDEKAAREFEGLMKSWPMNSWWRFFWTGKRLTEELSNWRAELSNLCLATDEELLKSLATKKLKLNGLNVLLVQELLALVNYRAARNTADLINYTE